MVPCTLACVVGRGSVVSYCTTFFRFELDSVSSSTAQSQPGTNKNKPILDFGLLAVELPPPGVNYLVLQKYVPASEYLTDDALGNGGSVQAG